MNGPLEIAENSRESTVVVGQVGPRSHGPLETELLGHLSNFGVRNERPPGMHAKIKEGGGVLLAERDR